jgi:hypothetical protein
MADEANQSSDKGMPIYDQMRELKPPRTSAITPNDVDDNMDVEWDGGLRKRMQMSPKLSDMQTADKRLFPVLKENVDWLNNLMVARVYPETYIPFRNIIVKNLLKEYPEMSVTEALALAELALSVAIDGEGRIDELALFGGSSAMAEEKEKGQ